MKSIDEKARRKCFDPFCFDRMAVPQPPRVGVPATSPSLMRHRKPPIVFTIVWPARSDGHTKPGIAAKHTNYHPFRESLLEPDAFEKYVGYGWLPAEPIIDRDKYITAFGSCFAAEVTKFLVKRGYRVFGNDMNLDAYIIRSGEGIVNTAALRQQFEWAFTNQPPKSAVWHDKLGNSVEYASTIQRNTRSIFEMIEVFIFTLGLSEVWYDKRTGDVFWRAVPKNTFDPDQHGFKVLGVKDNLDNLQRVYNLIRQHRPRAEIIVTLSPIPLAATFRPISCITANSVSKASLRVAIDELMRANPTDLRLHYFPSYEVITAFLEDPMGNDLRHPSAEAVDFIMHHFKRYYLID